MLSSVIDIPFRLISLHLPVVSEEGWRGPILNISSCSHPRRQRSGSGYLH